MKDTTSNAFLNVFFYGLYMDPEILASKNIPARSPRKATVNGYALRIGLKATLLRKVGAQATGMVYSLTSEEAYALYAGSGLTDYAAEMIEADVVGQGTISVLCYNLLIPPDPEEQNPEYARKLVDVKTRLGLSLS